MAQIEQWITDLATELVYDVFPWRGKSPEFMQSKVRKFADSIALRYSAHTPASGEGEHAAHVRELVKAVSDMKDGYEAGDELCGYIKPVLAALSHFEKGV